MNKKFAIFYSDALIISASLIFCAVFFVFDLIIPWAIGSTFYIIAVLFALQVTRPRLFPLIIAALTTLLTSVNLSLQFPHPDMYRMITSHLLAVSLIWMVTLFGLVYKKEHETESYLAAIVDSGNDAIIGKTAEGIVTSWNAGAEMMFGYKAKEMIGVSIRKIIPEANYSEEEDLISQVKEGHRVINFETVRKKKDGRLFSISLTLSPILNDAGAMIGISSVAKDITQRIQMENQLRIMNRRIQLEKQKLEEVLSIEEHLNTIFNVDRLADYTVEKTAKILEAERCSLMFYDEDGRSLFIKAFKGLDEKYLQDFRGLEDRGYVSSKAAKEGLPLLVEDIEKDQRFLRPNRSSYRTNSFCSVPIKLGSRLIGVINVAEKIDRSHPIFTDLDLKILSMIIRQVAVAMENARLYREMKYLTITDPLTSMNNFRHFSKSLDYEINRLKRFPGELSLIMIDVDHFKAYNDTFGHLEGDEALKVIGNTIARNVREVDAACRYAGDEFAVILPGVSVDKAQIIAEKLKKAVARIDLKRKLTISTGVASCGQEMNKYDLIQKADVALYQDKKDRPSEAGKVE